MKRPYFAASIASAFILLSSLHPADAISLRAIPNIEASTISTEIAASAKQVASAMSSVGYCYRGVKRALKKVGITLTGGEAYMARTQLASNEQFQRVSLANLQTGDILVHGKSGAHPHGHIAVYLGNGREASDHIGKLITGKRYGGTTVWRVRTNTTIAKAKPATEKPEQAATPRQVVAEAVAPVLAPVVLDLTSPQEMPDVLSPTASSVTPATPKPVDLTADISNALMQVIKLAQSAQINLTEALAQAVEAIS